jgi:hypothetical protein
MKSLALLLALAATAATATPAPLAGIWAVGEPSACADGNAWVLFADGFYAEVKLPSGPISAMGRWSDAGDALVYSHAHLPFAGHAAALPERRMTFTARTAERFEATAPSGKVRVFSRCPADALKAPAGEGTH